MTQPARAMVVFIILLLLAACAWPGVGESPLSPLSPLKTPAPTATPVPTTTPTPSRPTWTPWPRPTWTPIPTPTTLPIPTFPAEAVQPEGWPPLPADLYFIRDGSLWHWPRTGGTLEQVVAAPQQSGSSGGKQFRLMLGLPPTGVTAYRLTPDEQHLAFVFFEFDPTTAHLYTRLIVLNRIIGTSTTIPTAGNLTPCSPFSSSFDITPDGRYVIYLAWGGRPTTSSRAPGLTHPATIPGFGGLGYGTIFAVEVQNPNHEFELGYCAARSEVDFEVGCDGFVLSPDGKQIAFSDGRGMWLSEIPQGPSRLLAEHQYPGGFCGVWHVRNWSPNGHWLLIDVGCYEGGYAAVMDANTGETQEISHTWNYPNPYVKSTWSQNGESVLVSSLWCDIVYLAQTLAEDTAQETVVISDTWPGAVWPTDPHDLPDGRIGFANQQCVDSPEPRPGIYAVGRDGTGLELISLLPAAPCYTSSGIHGPFGTVLWAPDGSAYLYFTRDEQRAYQTNLLVGLTDGSALWDVRELLEGAHDFQWQPSLSGY